MATYDPKSVKITFAGEETPIAPGSLVEVEYEDHQPTERVPIPTVKDSLRINTHPANFAQRVTGALPGFGAIHQTLAPATNPHPFRSPDWKAWNKNHERRHRQDNRWHQP